ncbi:hypothetical protein FA15DRAFT_673481 [Coprinopsis marcescibilis]|uniref:SAP domain-containing protein n=1 Tax=Coprinopsis marcescibilis TaxID=230819 RepID=A0A5C3KKJ9_COPMA|nr:hypothetical protein FA15DRAFT_673481 [Coprinopsis marcescibilis]
MAPVAFAGALAPKKKSELQEIANALRVSDQGTKDELASRIRKHLDTHSDLEKSSQFSGLYASLRRRVGSVQPQAPPSATGRLAPPGTSSDKPRSTRITVLNPITESPPSPKSSPDLKPSSLQSSDKTPASSPSSPQFDTIPPPSPEIQRPLSAIFARSPVSNFEGPAPAPPSPAKSIIEAIPKSADIKAAVQRHTQDIFSGHTEYLEVTRVFLSNSQNLSTLTSLYELFYILHTVIPWKSLQLPLTTTGDGASLPLPYPPLAVFQTSAFWLVLLHWAFPTLIIPALVGNLVSFAPSQTKASTSGFELQFDSLTGAIVRLAAAIAYPFAKFASQEHVHGLDVIGYNTRVFNASITLAFAFAEAISTAPKRFAKTLAHEHKLAIGPVEAPSSVRALTARGDDRVSEEVD